MSCLLEQPLFVNYILILIQLPFYKIIDYIIGCLAVEAHETVTSVQKLIKLHILAELTQFSYSRTL